MPSHLLSLLGAAAFSLLGGALPMAAGADDTTDLRRFLAKFRSGEVDASVIGRLIPSEEPPPAFPAYERARHKLRSEPRITGAEVLLEAAVLVLDEDPARELERFATRQPWVIRRRAIDELCEYYLADELQDWAATKLAEGKATAAERRVLVEWLGAALAKRARPEIYELVKRALEDASAPVRGAAAHALAPVLQERDLLTIVRLLYDSDAAVRLRAAAALRAALQRKEEAPDPALRGRVLQLAAARLSDADAHVRVVLAEMLREQKNGLVLPFLVEALAAEERREKTPEARKRFRVAIEDLLHELTGRGSPPLRAAEWRKFLESEDGERSVRPEGLPGRTSSTSAIPRSYATYFGREVRSDHVVFVLDFSGSMRRRAGNEEHDRGEGPREEARRIDLAVREFLGYLEKLDEASWFNVVVFAQGSAACFDDLEAATAENRARARAFVTQLPLGGSTDLFSGIVRGLRCAGLEDGSRAGTRADTLFLLSDGIPTAGAVTDPADIARLITTLNREAGLAVNVVDLGARHSAFQKHLKSLAWQNGGEYIRP
ncbi:MAG: hypothetical protein JNM84_08815 [Planctomycetes bacterium]|nr:hypothetical protein [Planctomycetota bacterium]